MSAGARRAATFSEAELAGILLAVDPQGLRGVVLRVGPGPLRDEWLAGFRRLAGTARTWRKIPAGISTERLIGGLDFAASLAAGRPLFARGVLAESDGGLIEVSMAERVASSVAGILCAALDSRSVRVERDGFAHRSAADFAVVACDEGIDDEAIDPGLADRLAFHLDFNGNDWPELAFAGIGPDEIPRVRERALTTDAPAAICEALAGTALALGIDSLRADQFALRAARILAALDGRDAVDEEDASLAARLVYPNRATRMPATPEEESRPPPNESPADDASGEDKEPGDPAEQSMPDDLVLEAVRAALPAKLLEQSADRVRSRGESRGRGRGGAMRRRRLSGRPVGVVPADQAPGGRIDLLATLKAAAPWQSLRRESAGPDGRVRFERGDLRVTRYKDRTETTTVFVVDASGSQAAQRLGEVKGAIELLLADCYVRRDEVALIVFRQSDAILQLPPTRALARARKVLADVPAGGGTPLAAGIRKAAELVPAIRRQGRTPVVVFLTDGRANVALDGSAGAGPAQEDAEHAAREFRSLGLRPILVDSSRRPRRVAATLANAMGAAYLAMPYADARSLSSVIGAGRAA